MVPLSDSSRSPWWLIGLALPFFWMVNTLASRLAIEMVLPTLAVALRCGGLAAIGCIGLLMMREWDLQLRAAPSSSGRSSLCVCTLQLLRCSTRRSLEHRFSAWALYLCRTRASLGLLPRPLLLAAMAHAPDSSVWCC